MTYEERLKREYDYWEETDTTNDLFVDDAWAIARHTVSMQAEAIRGFYFSTFHDGDFLISDWLIKNGYIPEKEEE